MEKTNKFNEFAVLRALGALAVIAIHATSTFGQFEKTSFSYLFFGIINKFCNFAVPLFLFLSTALLTNNSLKKDRLKISEFYKKRLLKTFPVFIVWVVIYYFYLKLNNSTLISFWEEPLKFFTSYILEGSIYYHLYFMPIIFGLYILFPVIYFITKILKKIQMNVNVSFVLTFGLLILFQFAFLQIHKYYIWPYYQNPAIIVFSYSIAIGMGAWIGSNYEDFKNSKGIKILTFIIAIISGYFLIRYTLFPGMILNNLVLPIYTASASISLLCIAALIDNKSNFLKQFFYKVGEHSFTIYLAHPIILGLARKFIPDITLINSYFGNNFMNVFVKFILAFAISYFISVIIALIKEKIVNKFNYMKNTVVSPKASN